METQKTKETEMDKTDESNEAKKVGEEELEQVTGSGITLPPLDPPVKPPPRKW